MKWSFDWVTASYTWAHHRVSFALQRHPNVPAHMFMAALMGLGALGVKESVAPNDKNKKPGEKPTLREKVRRKFWAPVRRLGIIAMLVIFVLLLGIAIGVFA